MVTKICYCPTHGRVTDEEYDEETHGGCSTCGLVFSGLSPFKAKRPGES